ncbi:hypothetical protein FRC00_007632, partial [Tulasnella sp. 408]
ESRRVTIVFATTPGPAFAANASMGIVDERVEGSEGPGLFSRKFNRDDDDEPTTPGSSHKEPQVDLDRWEPEDRSRSPHSASASLPDQPTSEAPPLPPLPDQ